MERGLLWLPLLLVFFWLAWSGWNEYQKVEAYRLWAEQFDKSKYDIYAVLGLKGDVITWGKPTRSGIVNLNSFSLRETQNIRLLVNGRVIELEQLPSKGSPVLEFVLDSNNLIKIPFTEITLAGQWLKYLKEQLARFS
jgi:hypothetical protein